MSAKRKGGWRLVLAWGLLGCAATGSVARPPASSGPDAPRETTAQPPRELPKASGLVRDGERLLAGGDAGGAKHKFEAALAARADDGRAALGLGLAEEALGDRGAAERAYRRAIEIEPNLAEAHNNLGLVLRDRGEDAEALTALTHATELDPRLASAQANLALALEEAARTPEARGAYERAVALTPDDPMLCANYGLFLLDNGDVQAATVSLRRGLQHARGSRAALVALGNGLRRAAHPDEAVRALRAALAAGDGQPTPALLSELALAQHAAGDGAGAIASLEQAITLDAKYASAHYVLAGILAAQGELERATHHYKRCIEVDPKGPLAARAKEKLGVAKRLPRGR